MRAAILLGILLVLAACTAEAPETTPEPTPTQTFQCPDGTVVTDINACPKTIPEPVDEPDTTVEPEDVDDDVAIAREIFKGDDSTTKKVSSDIQAIIDRAEDKTKNGYSFVYFENEDGLPTKSFVNGGRVYLKNGEIAISWEQKILYEGARYNRYLDNGEEAVLWCQNCGADLKIKELETGHFAFEPAKDWLYDLENLEVVTTRTVDQRSVKEATGTFSGEEGTILIDEFSGVPVQITYGDMTIQYKDLALSANAERFVWPE